MPATPAVPPLAFAQAKAGRFEPGGVGGVTGGAEIRGPEATETGLREGGLPALGGAPSPQALRARSRHRRTAGFTPQWCVADVARRVGLRLRPAAARPEEPNYRYHDQQDDRRIDLVRGDCG